MGTSISSQTEAFHAKLYNDHEYALLRGHRFAPQAAEPGVRARGGHGAARRGVHIRLDALHDDAETFIDKQ